MDIKESEGFIGVCSCMLLGVVMECEGDYLGKDNLCDNPFIKNGRYTCKRYDINFCVEKGLVKLIKDDSGCVRACQYLKDKIGGM